MPDLAWTDSHKQCTFWNKETENKRIMKIQYSHENYCIYSGLQPQSQVKKEGRLIDQQKEIENLATDRENQAWSRSLNICGILFAPPKK